MSSQPDTPLDMDPEAMRRLGYKVVDLLVERMATLDAQPAWRGATRADMEARLREPAPPEGRDFDVLLERLARDVFDQAGRIDHPRFFAFVPSSPTWPGILGDFLTAGHNVFAGTWLESAGPSALELVVLDWFKEWIGYPEGAAGILLSGGSAANLTALACAREARLGAEWHDGVIYLSEQSHSSLARAARILGWSEARVRTLPVDDAGRLRAGALRTAVREDRAGGLRPFLVAASAGATSTGAVDPLDELADAAAELGLWLHADAAYGGFAVLTGRGAGMLRGIGRADSVTLDPHKWLFQGYETGCLLVREGALLPAAFHIMPDYLQDTAVHGGAVNRSPEGAEVDRGGGWRSGREVNFADRGLQLTRSARAVKIWLSIQHFGLEAFRETIDGALDLALQAEAWIREHPEFEILSPASLGIVCFRRRFDGADEEETGRRNAALVAGLAGSGVGMISSTRVDGRYALRLCIMNHRSGWGDVERVLGWLATGA